MPAVTQQREKLTGELTAFRAVGSDGWGYGTLTSDHAEIPITGKLLGVRPGDTVEVEGVWAEHKDHGRQLRVRTCTSVDPQTSDGVIAWMSSTLPQISAARARGLVDRFGSRLWNTIEQRHEELALVPGITLERAVAIRAAYMEHRKDRDHMVALRGWGLTDAQVARCVVEWKTLETVVERIRENPYQLSRAVHGFGFVRADVVAMKAGVKFDAPARIAAAVEHVLSEARGEGHCFLPTGMLKRKTVQLIGAVDVQQIANALRAAISGKVAVRRGARVYTRAIDTAEQRCVEALRKLMRAA